MIFCVRFARSVPVEWFDLKPCCVGERGMRGLMLGTNLLSIFDGLQRREIGRWVVGSLGGLLGLRIGMIFRNLQMLGRLLLIRE